MQAASQSALSYESNMAAPAKTIIDSFRDAVQDLLVPELKALRVSVDSLKTEMLLRNDKLQESIDATRVELRQSADSAKAELRLRDERMQESIRGLSQKLDFAIDIRERLAALEARLPRQ